MKTLNQFRNTNAFCILSQDMENITHLVTFAKSLKNGSLVGCAKDKNVDFNTYTIRVIYTFVNERVMADMNVIVKYDNSVHVLETAEITRYKV